MNCSNNCGPYHFPEKLIPHIIIRSLAEQSLPAYGDGANVRDWLHVEDHARALTPVLERSGHRETYNIGTRNERSNIAVVQAICALLDEIAPSPAGPRTRLITTKIERELGWRAAETFESGLRKTVRWYVDNRTWWHSILDRGYRAEPIGLARSASAEIRPQDQGGSL